MDAARHVALRLGISEEAVDLCRDSDLIDLHVDTFIPPRLWGYDPLVRHRSGPLGRHFFGHLDLYRMADGGVTGAMWSITTNPFRTARGRWKVFQRNLERLQRLVQRSEGQMELVRDLGEYRAARERGAHAVLLSIQGGHALEAAPKGAASVPDRLLTRVTLVHMMHSVYGGSSLPLNPFRRRQGLTSRGRELVEQLDQQRIFVDLAHIHRNAFWDVVKVHDPSRPLILTHTGVCGVNPHWRNVDDEQLRAVADSGGVAGIIFHAHYLRKKGSVGAALVVDHIEHVVKTVGEDYAAIGSDFDGAISPHPRLRSADRYPVLVEEMLRRGWSEDRIQKVLGANFLRCFEQLRPVQSGNR